MNNSPFEEIKSHLTTMGAGFADLQRRADAQDRRIEGLVARDGRPDYGGGATATEKQDLNIALKNFLQTGDRAAFATATKAMSVGTDPSGGYVVSPVLDNGIQQVLRDVSPFRTIARVRTLPTGDSLEFVQSRDAAGAEWVGETAPRTETDQPELLKTMIPLHEMYAQPQITQKLLDTANFNVLGWLQEQVGTAFGEKEATAFISGNGVAKPRGILTYPTAATADASRPWGTIEHVVTGADGAFAATDPQDALVDLVYALKTGYRRRAVWLMSRRTAGTIRKMKDAEGRFIWQDSLQQGQPNRLLGYPVVESEDMPALATGSLSVAFGDFMSAYTIVDSGSVRFLTDPYTAKPYVKIYATARTGGQVVNFDAVKLLEFSAA